MSPDGLQHGHGLSTVRLFSSTDLLNKSLQGEVADFCDGSSEMHVSLHGAREKLLHALARHPTSVEAIHCEGQHRQHTAGLKSLRQPEGGQQQAAERRDARQLA